MINFFSCHEFELWPSITSKDYKFINILLNISIPWEVFELLIWNVAGLLAHIWHKSSSVLELNWKQIWPLCHHLGFCFCLISRGAYELLIWNVAGLLVHISCRSSWILMPSGNPIWPPGSYLLFSFLHNISRNLWAIDLKFCRFIGTYKMQVKYDFGADRKSNMAARKPSWIYISAQYHTEGLSYCFESLQGYWYI